MRFAILFAAAVLGPSPYLLDVALAQDNPKAKAAAPFRLQVLGAESKGDAETPAAVDATADESVKPPVATEPSAIDEPIKPCQIIFVDGDLSKILVLNDAGEMLPNVRSVYVWTAELRQQFYVECEVYDSWYRPSSPKVVRWTLRSMRAVDEAEFQKIVDGEATE